MTKDAPGKLGFALEREVVIRAPRAAVFRYFTDSARFAAWWGAGSTIEGRVGGKLSIQYPGPGGRASGEVLALVPDERVVFTYGYEGEGKPIAPGASRVTITLADHPLGTRLTLVHEIADAPTRDLHVQGWRYQLALFANAVADEVFAGAGAAVARWFAAWNDDDAARRADELRALTQPDVRFHDAHGATAGQDDLVAHVAAAKAHGRGMRLELSGTARQCQGTVLADWNVCLPDGKAVARGTNVFELAPDGRIVRVVGLWNRG